MSAYIPEPNRGYPFARYGTDTLSGLRNIHRMQYESPQEFARITHELDFTDIYRHPELADQKFLSEFRSYGDNFAKYIKYGVRFSMDMFSCQFRCGMIMNKLGKEIRAIGYRPLKYAFAVTLLEKVPLVSPEYRRALGWLKELVDAVPAAIYDYVFFANQLAANATLEFSNVMFALEKLKHEPMYGCELVKYHIGCGNYNDARKVGEQFIDSVSDCEVYAANYEYINEVMIQLVYVYVYELELLDDSRKLIAELCESRSPAAFYIMGLFYMYGERRFGVPVDKVTGRALIWRAAECGLYLAQHKLIEIAGDHLEFDDDLIEHLAEKPLAKKYSLTYYQIGRYYMLRGDNKKGMAYIRDAASRGVAEASTFLKIAGDNINDENWKQAAKIFQELKQMRLE